MRQRTSGTELFFLTALPALLLFASALYLTITNLFHLQPYLMLCASGLMALCGCLLYGSGIYARMIRQGTRLGIGVTALLLTFWSLCYFLSGLLAAHPADLRALTGLSALPPLLIPAFFWYALRCAGRPADRQQPDTVFYVLLGVGICGSLLSLISIFIPLLYSFVGGEPVFGPGMTAVFLFFCAGVLLAQAAVLCRARKNQRLAPALLAALELLVFICMTPGISRIPAMLLPYAAPFLLFTFCFLLEENGLLPDGRDFPLLLQKSVLPVQLMDLDGTIRYGADAAQPVASGHKSSILNNRYHISLSLDPDTQLTAAAIRGGYALSQKDLRDLHALERELQEVSRELEQTNQLLSREHELEHQLQEATEKNEFFARQEKKIQDKTMRASVMLRCAAATAPEPGFRRAVVTRANILVTYVRQLGLLLQQARETDRLPISTLSGALEASAQAATAAGTRCRVYHVAQGTFPAEVVLTLYDLQELLLEDVISLDLPALELRLRNEQNGLRLVAAAKDSSRSGFPLQGERIALLAGEAGGTVRVTEDEGTVSVCMEFLKGGVRLA